MLHEPNQWVINVYLLLYLDLLK